MNNANKNLREHRMCGLERRVAGAEQRLGRPPEDHLDLQQGALSPESLYHLCGVARQPIRKSEKHPPTGLDRTNRVRKWVHGLSDPGGGGPATSGRPQGSFDP